MQELMKRCRSIASDFDSAVLGGFKAVGVDYQNGINGLPKENIIKFLLEWDCSVFIRSYGTEPKIKAYLSIMAEDKSKAELLSERILVDVEKIMLKYNIKK